MYYMYIHMSSGRLVVLDMGIMHWVGRIVVLKTNWDRFGTNLRVKNVSPLVKSFGYFKSILSLPPIRIKSKLNH